MCICTVCPYNILLQFYTNCIQIKFKKRSSVTHAFNEHTHIIIIMCHHFKPCKNSYIIACIMTTRTQATISLDLGLPLVIEETVVPSVASVKSGDPIVVTFEVGVAAMVGCEVVRIASVDAKIIQCV